MFAAEPNAHLGAQSLQLSLDSMTATTLVEQDTSTNKSPLTDQPKRRGAWIRYRTELRHRDTGELLHRIDSDTPRPNENEHLGEGPIFELITKYNAKEYNSKQEGSRIGQSSASPSSIILRILSVAIINALQTIVEYYPGQNLSGDVVEFAWPYAILVHHYDELKDFKTKCQSVDISELCAREKDAPEHIDRLVEFLDENIMKSIRAERTRLAKGFHTFENFWIPYKPGRTVGTFTDRGEWQPYVVSEVTGGILENPPVPWIIKGWRLKFNGTYVGRCKYSMEIPRFDGEKEFAEHTDFVDNLEDVNKGVLKQNVAYGEMWYKLLRKNCRNHIGKSLEFPYNEIEGFVMADLETFYADEPERKPSLMDDTDCRRWSSDCTCNVCQKRALEGPRKVRSRFDDYMGIVPSRCETLSPHMYLLCPSSMYGFVFKMRAWENLHVKNYHLPEFHESMIDSLVMDPSRIKILKALAKSYIRINQRGNHIEHDPWAADFVRGKGSGLIFLLHGKPGVGKTVTAEAIAEYTKRPLMVLTSADVGTNPSVVEANLTEKFKTARRWGAVLLIDEADVFMERRGTADLERNGLVAAFLRALEFYEGILFLTTNRVGAFDDAFISRIHVQLFYKDFTDDERQQVWLTFMKKLTEERGKYIRVTVDAKDYIRGAEVRAVKWNGREIRNAFQTAVSLAEYEDERDEEGKIKLTDEHLRAVVELSKDFKEYLRNLHKADEDKRALRRYERLDT